ncbi:type I polyketide synthase [Chondromyces apiculatus]|uniref:Malonyl CoA-acyl carrier protein transacylase n=1 Tax=Chondromyces apiculatus DSM 436 TaxID=1192034 RepID=A0A017TJ36_9BACT|nr:type I polyketide synthase [Chondromyces apiculatus]EYF08907.1 Malonyl CoA-acyl carrier protein transacylase [Chondromyces apiculatus DSM 436]
MDKEIIEGIAIIGMSGRFPGAGNVDDYWQNLRNGVESISTATDAELAAAGVPSAVRGDSAYVRARGVLEGIEDFDASFFGMTPREAALTDPQHRLFLECAWEALESAGHARDAEGGMVGVYAGSSESTYLDHAGLAALRGDLADRYQVDIATAKDFLATRTSYKLDLRGPSLNVQTACSTSLVAVYLACQALLVYQCDMALAGGAAIAIPQRKGTLYREGMILSPDGHCRAFDASARGTVSGNGVGVVVLRRLSDALADGDPIRAVIRGVAVNNDGAGKVGFTAPSVEGQMTAILQALAMAGIDAGSIGYIEAHGTGTPVGDPIEIAALTQAFQASSPGAQRCAIGSVKTNIGHLDAAAGVAGLIKTALALEHRELPPSLHFETPNPRIDFASSPFHVNATLSPWPRQGDAPRRAGVSSFGIGGTNAHAILEEAPPAAPSGPSRPFQLLTLSARSPAALDATAAALARHLDGADATPLPDIAYTLQVGRKAFAHRRVLVASSALDAARALEAQAPQQVFSGEAAPEVPPVVFMFPGQGVQHPGMGRDLYEAEPAFRRAVDRCAEILTPHLGFDIRPALHASPDDADAAARLQQTSLAQPALFTTSYALAQLWKAWGVEPTLMVGHSLGELVAACLSGVFSLEDALALVAARGRMMLALPGGAMLAVPFPEDEALALLGDDLSLAAVNGPERCVIAGPEDAIARLAGSLEARAIGARRLRTSHAFHARAMDAIVEPFSALVARIPRSAPTIPFYANLTGRLITPEEAVDPAYWGRHLRETVRFGATLDQIKQIPRAVLIEVGPGRTLTALAQQSGKSASGQVVIPSLTGAGRSRSELASMLEAAGRCWIEGVPLDSAALYADERRRRVPLPTYPFERQRHWLDAAAPPPATPSPEVRIGVHLESDQQAIVRLADAAEAESPWEHFPEGFERGAAELCSRYIARFLQDSGVVFAPGRTYDRNELVTRLGIIPKFRKFFTFFLETLAEDGILQLDGDRVEILKDAAAIGDPAPLRAELGRRYPDLDADLRVLDHCVAHYGDALTGRIDPIGVLHPDGSTDFLRPSIENSVRFSGQPTYYALLEKLVVRLFEHSPGKKLRILEAGGGTGAVTFRLMPALRGRDVDYHFTDLGRYFLVQAEKRAAREGLDFMRFGMLDVSRDPASQGHDEGAYDLVIAYNVVHATLSVTDSLANLKRLLAPGGVLLLMETTQAPRWYTLIWGLEVGWWYFADEELRPSSPFMSPEGWAGVLRSVGFPFVEVCPPSPERQRKTDCTLLLAQESFAPAAREAACPPRARAPQGSAPRQTPDHGRPAATPARPATSVPPRAPRNEIERQVAAIFQDVLGMDAGVNDDFFALGGDSLMAVQLLARLRKAFNVPLTQHALLQAPTIAALARFFAGESSAPEQVALPPEILELQRGAPGRPPLLLIHPAGGHTYFYRELVQALGADQPVAGVRAVGLEEGEAPFDRMEPLIDHYTAAIRAFQPVGPYHLGGSSFGGAVAFGIASALRAAGQEVALLAVIDCALPGRLPEERIEDDEALSLAYLLRVGTGVDISADTLRALDGNARLRRFLELGRRTAGLPQDADLPDLRRLLDVFQASVRALRRYTPAPYPGKILFLRARERDAWNPPHPEIGWSEMAAGGVEVHTVPGNHITMNFQPHVSAMAARLRDHLVLPSRS